MTERSLYWGGTTIGDASLAPYDNDEFSDILRKLFIADRTIHGVVMGYLNELAVTGTATPVSVGTGAAFLDGNFYEADAAVTVAIPTPAASTRIDRIVLRKDFAGQTIRVTRIAGVEGGSAPALTQSDGVTWDISLATVSITTGGVITVTDTRVALTIPLSVKPVIGSVASSATPTIQTGIYNVFRITALAAAITSMTSGLIGTPYHGQRLIIEILDDGTARAIAWGAKFRSTDSGTLPTTTTLGKLLRVGLLYDSVDAIWDCMAVSNEV